MKHIEQGVRVPYGLSSHDHGYRLKLPVGMWYGKKYDIDSDLYYHGWYVPTLCIKTEISGFQVHWGKQRFGDNYPVWGM